jgi:hypothetical protein
MNKRGRFYFIHFGGEGIRGEVAGAAKLGFVSAIQNEKIGIASLPIILGHNRPGEKISPA